MADHFAEKDAEAKVESADGKSPDVAEVPTRPPPKKRRRIVISCTECHRRKQKCDRNLPCANCVSRHKQDACRYETGAPTPKKQTGGEGVDGNDADGEAGGAGAEADDSLQSKVANFGYSNTGASTMTFLKKIDTRLAGDSLLHGEHIGTRERYKSIIRQLPARTYIDKLVPIYFREFNWQYYGLDEDVFMSQLDEWNNLPLSVFNTQGPQALSPDLRAFPALLFQVIATALLLLPPGGSETTFEALKYAGGMTFEDLAMDYSESGMSVLSLLGKRQMSITTVLTGFLRASFLKYVAMVTEAWHAIGSAIRDAQEIGLHRDNLDPKPASDDAEAVLENQWEIQRRRRLWMTLVGWDVHTGAVLGRPTTIERSITPTLCVDAPIPKDRSKTPVLPRNEDDPPTPLTRALWSYDIMLPLRDILDLEKEGPCPKSFAKVDQIHEELIALQERTPPYFRLENPDPRFDALPECYWLPYVRATLPSLMSFNFMALHRPYIFTRPKSRTEALKASLSMLHSQRMHFQTLSPHQYKMFSLFFGTFDAVVMMASIYILFPKEHPELLQNAMQHFQWSVERFETMSERNRLAKAALSVLQAIYIRLKKSLGMGFVCAKSPAPTTETPASMPGSVSPSNIDPSLTNGSMDGGSSTTGLSGYTPGSNSISTSSVSEAYSSSVPSVTPAANDGGGGPGPTSLELSFPSDFDWSSIQPIYATGDLAYNDLIGIANEPSMQGLSTANAATDIETQLPWQFDGGFTDNSVWNVLNQYTPF